MKTPQKIRTAWELGKEMLVNWYASDRFRLSAVVAYYAVFSPPGLLLIVVTITGYFAGEDVVRGKI